MKVVVAHSTTTCNQILTRRHVSLSFPLPPPSPSANIPPDALTMAFKPARPQARSGAQEARGKRAGEALGQKIAALVVDHYFPRVVVD